MKVVLCGPPHSGKSCLRFGLKEAIKSIPESPYPYVITACPDGEGSWFQETVSENPNLATELKAAYKGKFTEEQVKIMGEWVKNCSEPLTLIDIGGIPDSKNEHICAYATHAILLAGILDHLQEWRAFCEKLKLQIIAELYSDYHGTEDTNLLLSKDNIYRGSIHHLERGDLSVQQRPTVLELAQILVNMVAIKE
jgi:CRISPR-associated protein Csx3